MRASEAGTISTVAVRPERTATTPRLAAVLAFVAMIASPTAPPSSARPSTRKASLARQSSSSACCKTRTSCCRPQGIKDFLSYAYSNWVSPSPQYVLLVGDASYDAKDNYGLGTVNYVPTYLAQTPFMGESLTDEWYVRISGNDAIADMAIGRLPASTTAQAETIVTKIISYENTPVLKTWERNTLLVADNQVEGYEIVFELMSEDVAALVPAGMNAPFKEYLNDYGIPNDLSQSMINRLNGDGALIWNYSGHGSVQMWAEGIFSTGDAGTLNKLWEAAFCGGHDVFERVFWESGKVPTAIVAVSVAGRSLTP